MSHNTSAWLLFSELSPSAFTDAIWAEQRAGVCARIVRANKMANEASLFDEWAAALQFPYYFGDNWPAFAECCADLDWLPGDAIVVGILNASAFAGTDAMLRSMFEALQNAREELAQKTSWRSSRSLTVRLQVGSDLRIRERLSVFGVETE